MDFKKSEDVLKFMRENDYWNTIYEHANVLEMALTPENINYIFELMISDTESPLIYESGCSSGLTTTQICRYLSKGGIKDYKLIAHDIRQNAVNRARRRFLKNRNISIEWRSGFNYSDIPDEFIDAIFSFNTMVPFLYTYYTKTGDQLPYNDYLKETSRVLKEGKPLVLTYLWVPLILIKDSKIHKAIPFQVRLYKDHSCVDPFLKALEFIKPIGEQ